MRIVLAMTGASGSAYALRLLEVLRQTACEVHLTISPAAAQVLKQETGLVVDLDHFDPAQLIPGDSGPAWCREWARGREGEGERESEIAEGELPSMDTPLSPSPPRPLTPAPLPSLTYHHYRDFSAGIASGSYRTDGMVICPCSMGTLAGIAQGLSSNLIQRAADVHLKERRRLIVVPRETPLGSIQLENMKRLADAGAVVLPAMPGFYHQPTSIRDLIDFIVGRICDQLGLPADLIRRWGE